MKITIESIPHKEQRYETCGDWLVSGPHSNPEIKVYVSRTSDWRLEALVGIHEAVEAVLCFSRGVTEESVSEFDIDFEKERAKDPGHDFLFRGRVYGQDDEPGDSPMAPYQNEHNFATAVERMLCAALGISWARYEDAIGELEPNL